MTATKLHTLKIINQANIFIAGGIQGISVLNVKGGKEHLKFKEFFFHSNDVSREFLENLFKIRRHIVNWKENKTKDFRFYQI